MPFDNAMVELMSDFIRGNASLVDMTPSQKTLWVLKMMNAVFKDT